MATLADMIIMPPAETADRMANTKNVTTYNNCLQITNHNAFYRTAGFGPDSLLIGYTVYLCFLLVLFSGPVRQTNLNIPRFLAYIKLS